LGPNKSIKASSSRQVFEQHLLSNNRPSSHKVKDTNQNQKTKKFRKYKKIVKVKKQSRKFPILFHRIPQKVTPESEKFNKQNKLKQKSNNNSGIPLKPKRISGIQPKKNRAT